MLMKSYIVKLCHAFNGSFVIATCVVICDKIVSTFNGSLNGS